MKHASLYKIVMGLFFLLSAVFIFHCSDAKDKSQKFYNGGGYALVRISPFYDATNYDPHKIRLYATPHKDYKRTRE